MTTGEIISVVGIVASVVVPIFTVLLGGYIARRIVLKREHIVKNLEDLGFNGKVRPGRLKNSDLKYMFKYASSIKIMFISGKAFLDDYASDLKAFAAEGKSVQLLLANPESQFIVDYEILQKGSQHSKRKRPIKDELEHINKLFENSDIKIRHYYSEYRLPIIIAEFGKEKTQVWYCTTLVPQHTDYSVWISAEKIREKNNKKRQPITEDETTLSLVEMIKDHYDAVWNKSVDSKVVYTKNYRETLFLPEQQKRYDESAKFFEEYKKGKEK